MRQRRRSDLEFEESFEGAVDIVFLLMIFFLVASSFKVTMNEEFTLPQRDPQQVESSASIPEEVLISITADTRVLVGSRELELVDPSSIETYDAVHSALSQILARSEADGEPRPVPVLRTDRESRSGATVQALLACVDLGLKPRVMVQPTEMARAVGAAP